MWTTTVPMMSTRGRGSPWRSASWRRALRAPRTSSRVGAMVARLQVRHGALRYRSLPPLALWSGLARSTNVASATCSVAPGWAALQATAHSAHGLCRRRVHRCRHRPCRPAARPPQRRGHDAPRGLVRGAPAPPGACACTSRRSTMAGTAPPLRASTPIPATDSAPAALRTQSTTAAGRPVAATSSTP